MSYFPLYYPPPPCQRGSRCCFRPNLGFYGCSRMGAGGALGWVGLGQGLIRTRCPTACAPFGATQWGSAIRGCPVARPTGLLTAPEPRGGTRGREMPPSRYVWRAYGQGKQPCRVTRQCRAWPSMSVVEAAGRVQVGPTRRHVPRQGWGVGGTYHHYHVQAMVYVVQDKVATTIF